MRHLFSLLSAMIHLLLSPVTLILSLGLIVGAWFIARQLRTTRTSNQPLPTPEWIGEPLAEWFGP